MTPLHPIIIDHIIKGVKFLINDETANNWYHNPKPYVKLEFDYVRDNIKLDGQRIIDGGCHHGYYTLLFAKYGGIVTAVDPSTYHVGVAKKNLKLNNLNAKFVNAAIWNNNGKIGFNGGSRVGDFEYQVPALTLETIDCDAQVIKLDIEGSEYQALPYSIDKLPNVHSWIVEAHGDQSIIVNMFLERDYKVKWLNRTSMKIEDFTPEMYKFRSTIFATRDLQ